MDGSPPDSGQTMPQPKPMTAIRAGQRARAIALKAKRDQAVSAGDWERAGDLHELLLDHLIKPRAMP